jgi:hypothetical protein
MLEVTNAGNIDITNTIVSATWNGVAIDISSYTNLVAGTNITLSGDTLNVDDAFLVNNASDTTTGVLTTAGLTITTGNALTLGVVQWDDGSDKIEGNILADDSVDDDALDFTSITLNDFTVDIASTQLTDTADILYEAELDTFSELQTQIADKTLLNKEDAATIDSAWTFSGGVTGALTGNVIGDLTGNADTAELLETTRTFSISGDVTASGVTFNGGGNVDLVTAFASEIIVNTDISQTANINADKLIDGTTNAIATLTQETNWDTHLSSDGSDHTFIDQDVTSGSSPTLDNANMTGNISVWTNDSGYLTSISGSTEEVQDIVGGMVTGNTEVLIAVTYQDSDGTLDFVVDEASIDHDALTNFVGAEHFIQASITQVGTIVSGVWNGTAIDISSFTNLQAGTNITLSGDTLNVDDAFLINDGDDETTGSITAAGFVGDVTGNADTATNVQDADFGDVVVASGAWTVQTVAGADVILGTGTLGNYAAGDAEAGNALTGDSATAFFSSGTIEHERGGLETDISAITNSDFIVGTGAGTLGLESGATARTSLGLGTGDSPTFTNTTLTGDLILATAKGVEWWSGGGRVSYIEGTNSSKTIDIYAEDYVNITANTEDIVLKTNSDDIELDAADNVVIKGDKVQIFTSGDIDDYIEITTVSNVPTIGTVGACNLKITASSGIIDFDDETRTGTGGVIWDGGNSAQANTAFAERGSQIAGTNLTWDGSELDVDDAFLVNDANDSTTGILTATGFIVGDNQTAEWGAGDGAGGDLGCDGRLYSDGDDLFVQVESPTGAVYTNPAIKVTYHNLLGIGAYIPVLQPDNSLRVMVMDRYLYVKDVSGTNDSLIYIADKADDNDYLTLQYDSTANKGIITTSEGPLQLGAATNILMNPLGTGVRVGSTVTPAQALHMGDDKLIALDTNAGITASTTQSQGQGALTAQVNQISTVANDGDTVTLPAASAGVMIEIVNNGAKTLQIFPASGDDLGLGANNSEELKANESVGFIAYDSTNWAKESSTEIIHAEIHDEDNTDAFVVNDAGGDFHSYHTNGLVAGDLADWAFDAGGAGTSFPIASIANSVGSPGTQILVTTTGAHGLAVGDIISQTNLADAAYVGIFEVKATAAATTYEVTAAYTADGTGTMDQAATLTADAVAAGVYDFAYYISATSVGNNETFDFRLYKEATVVTGSKIRRKFGAGGDFGSMAGGGVAAVANGDKISFALSNEDSSANITIRNLTLVLVRL